MEPEIVHKTQQNHQNVSQQQLQQNDQQTFKRQGSNLHQLERESKKDQIDQKQSVNVIKQGCVWGIQKFFDQKQCLKHFRKNFKVYGEEDQQCPIKLQFLFKGKNRNYYVITFSRQSAEHLQLSYQQYNQKWGKNKKVKLRQVPENMNRNQFYFRNVEQIAKPAQKNKIQATEEELEYVRSQKIQDIVTSLHRMSYQDQVKQKIQDLNKVIQNYNTQFFRDAQVKRLLSQQNKDLQPLKLSSFVECPIQCKRTQYRSKSEFTIGKNDKKEVVIGFNKGSYKNNTIMVQSPKNVNIISKNTKLIVAVVQNFIKTNFIGVLEPFDRFEQVGFWRYLIVRESQRTNQSMIMVVCKTQNVDEKLIAEVKEKIINYCKLAIKGLKSLCFLSYNGEADSVPTEKPEVLYGTSYYEQKIFDHTFQVSSSAFLQINIPMSQVLYQQIIKAVKDCDIVLDLGSGIGTIGISIKNRLPNVRVIGIEICEQAVQDSKRNCADYEVYLGRAEDFIKKVCQEHRGKRIIAVLDPPRAGFNKDVLVALRRTRGLDNIIYVACNAKAIQDNILQLTLPVTAKRKAPEFIIKSMLGLDLFPQTPHYEALYILERT